MALTSGEYLRWYSSSRVSISFGVSAVLPAAVSASLSSLGISAFLSGLLHASPGHAKAPLPGVGRGWVDHRCRKAPAGRWRSGGKRACEDGEPGAGHADDRAGPDR